MHARSCVFDYHDTLVNARHIQLLAWQEASGEDWNPLRERIVLAGLAEGLPADEIAKGFLLTTTDEIALVERKRAAFARLSLTRILPFVGVRKTLEALNGAGCRVGLITLWPPDLIRVVLSRLKLSTYFDVVESRQPGAEPSRSLLLARAVSRLDCRPPEVLFVGDSEADYQAAVTVGTRFLRFRPPTSDLDTSHLELLAQVRGTLGVGSRQSDLCVGAPRALSACQRAASPKPAEPPNTELKSPCEAPKIVRAGGGVRFQPTSRIP